MSWDPKTQKHWMFHDERNSSIKKHITHCNGQIMPERLFPESIAWRCTECDANWPHARERPLLYLVSKEETNG